MLETLLGVLLFIIGIGSGYAIFAALHPKQPPVIYLPEIKINIPEIKVVGSGTKAFDYAGFKEITEKYEKALDGDRNIEKAEEMTEEYMDLNMEAQELMDDYLEGKVHE